MRERYLNMRKSKIVDLQWFYDFFIEKSGKSMDPYLFQQTFSMFFGLNQNSVIEFLDKYFNITTLIDKNQQEIKVLY